METIVKDLKTGDKFRQEPDGELYKVHYSGDDTVFNPGKGVVIFHKWHWLIGWCCETRYRQNKPNWDRVVFVDKGEQTQTQGEGR